ncbi:MAG: TAXI family TRAP transporter solute-binding subunit [Geminicoccaceae bacterium]|nr:TAXI family TRAP transporter solute-binding subunit [Geminicoccaceae bacterium]MDW8340556.1 TAXI family TRAP transporter solute-binding subunit [Geminicoccaceae bacterium]
MRYALRCAWLILAVLAASSGSVRSVAHAAGASEVERANRDTVGIVSGSVTGTYARFAQDLADALDAPGELRIIAMLGKGSIQNVADLLYLRNVDAAIVQSDVLQYFKENRVFSGIEEKIRYVTKLYNEEVHVLARPEISSLKDLAGKKVNIGPKGSGTAMTSRILFDIEDIPIEALHLSNSEALAALRAGSIAAAVFVVGKPATYFREIRNDLGLRFLPVELTKGLEDVYLDAELTSEDYPNLVPPGERIPTIAVGAVLAVYNWKPGTSRFDRTNRFVRRLLESLPLLQTEAYHPKWKAVDLRATIPGWRRLETVEQWLAAN